MNKGKKNPASLAGQMPRYRKPEYDKLSDLVAGRVQAGPQSTPPKDGFDLEDWQDPDLFHSPEL